MSEQTHTSPPEAVHHTGEESRGAVLAAMAANFLIACGKFVAGALTGSAAMFAEAVRSAPEDDDVQYHKRLGYARVESGGWKPPRSV